MESTPACYKCFPGYKCPSHRPVSIEVSFMYDQQCLLQMPVNLVVEPDETLASLKRRVIAAAGNRGSHVNPETAMVKVGGISGRLVPDETRFGDIQDLKGTFLGVIEVPFT